MKEKKEILKEELESIISIIEAIKTQEDLEKVLGEKWSPSVKEQLLNELNTLNKETSRLITGYNTRGDFDLSLELKLKRERIHETYRKLREITPSNQSYPTSLKQYNRIQSILMEISKLNYWVTPEAEEVFNRYKESRITKEKMELLDYLIQQYTKQEEQTIAEYRQKEAEITNMIIKREHIRERKNTARKLIFNHLHTEKYKKYYTELSQVTNKNRKIHRVLKDLERLKKIESPTKKDLNRLELTNEDLIDKNKFIDPKNDVEKDYQKVLIKISNGEYLTSKNNDENSIPREIQDLLKEMNKLTISEIEELIILAVDIIKNKRKSIRYGESVEGDREREFLKMVGNEFERSRPIVYEDTEDTSAYYHIIEKLLDDDRNYECIKRLLTIEEFKKARAKVRKKEHYNNKTVVKTEKEHIVLSILDKFIDNYKIKLLNQGNYYIEPDYYKEILKLFMNNQTKLNTDEQESYNTKLREFKDFITNKNYASSQTVISDIEQLQVGLNLKEDQAEIMPLSKEEKESLYLYSLEKKAEINKIKGYPEYSPSSKVKTFQVEGLNQYAFSIVYEGNKKINMNIHILDNSSIKNELESVKQQLIDYNLSFSTLEEDNVYPTIAFINGFKKQDIVHKAITPANIKIDKYYTKEDLKNKIQPREIKDFIDFVARLKRKNKIELNTPEEVIDSYVMKVMETSPITQLVPLIYQSHLKNQDSLVLNNHMETSHILSKIKNKRLYNQIYNIIDSKDNATYYSFQKTKDRKLELNPSTEEGVYMLSAINLVNDKMYNPEFIAEEATVLLEKLNSQNDYIPSYLTKENNKKLSEITKEYKKTRN